MLFDEAGVTGGCEEDVAGREDVLEDEGWLLEPRSSQA